MTLSLQRRRLREDVIEAFKQVFIQASFGGWWGEFPPKRLNFSLKVAKIII